MPLVARPIALSLSWIAGSVELAAALDELAPDVRFVVTGRGARLEGDAAVVAGAPPPEEEAEWLAALRAFAAAGGAVLGLGPGVRVLCAAGLLPGRVEPVAAAAAPSTHVRVEGRATSFTWAIPAGRVLEVDAGAPTARYVDPDPVALESAGRVVLRYCDGAGGLHADSVAGVCDAGARVVGLLPGTTTTVRALRGDLGRQLLGSLRLAVAARRR